MQYALVHGTCVYKCMDAFVHGCAASSSRACQDIGPSILFASMPGHRSKHSLRHAGPSHDHFLRNSSSIALAVWRHFDRSMGLANRETGLKEADNAGRGGATPSRVFAGVSGSWENQKRPALRGEVQPMCWLASQANLFSHGELEPKTARYRGEDLIAPARALVAASSSVPPISS